MCLSNGKHQYRFFSETLLKLVKWASEEGHSQLQ